MWIPLWILLYSGMISLPLHSQVVPSQANIDAQAQRRLQEQARESMRRRRIDENLLQLQRALDPVALSGPKGAALTRRALAALADLSDDNLSPRDSLQQAAQKSPLEPSATKKTSAYLMECWTSVSGRITPEDLPLLRQGLEPKTPLSLPPFQP